MTTDAFQTQFHTRLTERWSCPAPVGLSVEEITELVGIHHNQLPAVYIAFLTTCGRQAGNLFYDYHWTAESRVTRNQEMHLVAEELDFRLPNNLFTFLDYIGDYFWCFDLQTGEDPAVLRYDLVELVDCETRLSESHCLGTIRGADLTLPAGKCI